MGIYSPNFIGNYLHACARHNGDGEALVHGTRRLTWARFVERVDRVATALIRRGVGKGDKVALMFHNTPEFFEANFGAQVAGAIPVPLSYRFTAPEVKRQVEHCDASILLTEAHWTDAVAGADLEGVVTVCSGDPAPAGSVGYEAFVASGDPVDPRVPTALDDEAVILYTGGTTGYPKGVMLTYGAHLEMFASLLAGLVSRGARLRLSDEQLARVVETFPLPGFSHLYPVVRSTVAQRIAGHPVTHGLLRAGLRGYLARPELARLGYGYSIRYLSPTMPFFHAAAYQLIMLGVMVGNLVFVMVDRPHFDGRAVLETIQRERPFFVGNVPTGWRRLVEHPDLERYDVSSVRIAATGAGVCSVELKRRMMERFPGLIILDMLGQTEMTPITTFRIDADPSALRERSVGEAIVDVRIVDDEGRDLPRGQTGEIWYRSRSMMKGYYKDREATRRVTADGWLRSGDLGYLDGDGELRIVDRKNECINTGGEKVYPLEVEERLSSHPAVERACVIGVPDEEWGHAVRAVVQLREGQRDVDPEQLRRHCRQGLAGYKVPRSIVLVDELPLSPVGKILRGRVREQHGRPG